MPDLLKTFLKKSIHALIPDFALGSDLLQLPVTASIRADTAHSQRLLCEGNATHSWAAAFLGPTPCNVTSLSPPQIIASLMTSICASPVARNERLCLFLTPSRAAHMHSRQLTTLTVVTTCSLRRVLRSSYHVDITPLFVSRAIPKRTARPPFV